MRDFYSNLHSTIQQPQIKVILFGAGTQLQSFLFSHFNNRYLLDRLCYIVDNDSSKWGSTLFGLEIKAPTELLGEDKEKTVIFITANSHFESITSQLMGMGFVQEKNYFSFEHYNNTTLYSDRELLVTCYTHAHYTGGLYKVSLKKDKVEQIKEGNFLGVCTNNDGFAILSERSVMLFDRELHQYDEFKLNTDNLDFHGIAYKDGFYYIVETKTNTLKVLNENTMKVERQVTFGTDKDDVLHLNDILLKDDKIYLSMISSRTLEKPLWGLKNGGIVILDKQTLKPLEIYKNKLNTPHSLLNVDGDIYYCNSGEFTLENAGGVVAQFTGFTRGLAFDNQLFYVGQSFYRHKVPGHVKNLSVDCGIYVYDPILQISRFIKVPSTFIYAIEVIK